MKDTLEKSWRTLREFPQFGGAPTSNAADGLDFAGSHRRE